MYYPPFINCLAILRETIGASGFNDFLFEISKYALYICVIFNTKPFNKTGVKNTTRCSMYIYKNEIFFRENAASHTAFPTYSVGCFFYTAKASFLD